MSDRDATLRGLCQQLSTALQEDDLDQVEVLKVEIARIEQPAQPEKG
jgi:hypothetical protein